jgi:very-short-patch-repair endonuclease
LLLVRAGIPEPSLNVGVSSRQGRLLGRGDLVWPEWRTVVEYDGDNHRTSDKQYDRDIRRIEDFVAAEWRVVRVRKRGLFVATSDTVARVRSALAAGGWRPGLSNRLKST